MHFQDMTRLLESFQDRVVVLSKQVVKLIKAAPLHSVVVLNRRRIVLSFGRLLRNGQIALEKNSNGGES